MTARATSSGSSASETGLSKNGVSTIPGSITVTRTPVPLSFQTRGLAHRRDRELRRRVERAGKRPPAGDGSGQEEVAARLGQRLQRRPDRQRGTVYIRQNHRAPVLGRLLQEAARGSESGVREGDVEAAELLERPGDHRFLVSPLGDVASHGQRTVAAAELVGQLVEAVSGAGGEHQAVAVSGGSPRRGGTDPARSAGDQEDRIGHSLAGHHA